MKHSDPSPKKPVLSPVQVRKDKLSQALKANLKRRKTRSKAKD